MTKLNKGRPRKAPAITLASLPDRTGMSAEDRVRISRLSLALHGNLTAPSNRKAPHYGVGDATPQRMDRARENGIRLQKEEELLDSGEPTGLSRKRLIGRLEQLRNRDAISAVGFAAAQQFQKHVCSALSKAGCGVINYAPRMIDCVPAPELHRIEIALDHQRRVMAAYRVIPIELHPMLDWLSANAIGDQSDLIIAKIYWPKLNDKSRAERFRALLELCLSLLARHYHLDSQHHWSKIPTSRTAEEITKLLEQTDEKICA
jgi:hypothetical protein